ncbi:MAG: hypothetical protein C0429_09780 [Sphingopyxis sp.]|nr:hypothetical protein [Sphingopyxis sp.]
MISTLLTVVILCSNANWQHSERCIAPVDYFVVEENGESWGFLTSGVQFTQRNVSNELGARLQRFQLEDAYWFVTDKGVIEATTETEALSIYLTR